METDRGQNCVVGQPPSQMIVSILEIFFFLLSASTYVSPDSSVSFSSLLNQDLHSKLSLTLLSKSSSSSNTD